MIQKIKTLAICSAFASGMFSQMTSAEETLLTCQVITPNVIWTEEDGHIFSENEIDLIALITMAEAEGEDEYGKRLVIDTIINRVKSDYFPDTVEEVIYQPNHFESVWNGRVEECYVEENIVELVYEEIEEVTDEYVYFFCTGDYSQYGEPMYQVGNHYFSTYE